MGASLFYACDDGYGTLDPIETVCGDNFTWSLDPSPPSCMRSKKSLLTRPTSDKKQTKSL